MSAVVERFEQGTAVAAANPMQLLQSALDRGATIEQMQQLMDLQERWESNNARKAFVAAMAAFKSEPVELVKSKYVDIPGGAKFYHATLADVVAAAVPAMAKHGLSHKWETQQQDGAITVTCIVTHELGHSERTTLTAAADDSGKKNPIQSIASAVAYLERYTLLAATGLAAKDMDDDGKSAPGKKPAEASPQGYDDWKLDMKAKADEGLAALTSTWSKCDGAYRRYVIKYDEQWWKELKATAAKVKVPE